MHVGVHQNSIFWHETALKWAEWLKSELTSKKIKDIFILGDDKTGDYNLKFNLMNMLEDYYLPVRGGQSGTEIDTLSGMEFTGIDDIEYLRNRMMAALKVPKSFLGYEEGISGKATLAAEDIRSEERRVGKECRL